MIGSLFAGDPPRTPLEKTDRKKIAATLIPKGYPKEVLAVLGDRDGRYDSVAIRRDGGQMVIGGMDGQVRLFDLTTLKLLGTAMHKDVVCVTYSASGKSVIAGDALGNLKIWTIVKGKLAPAATVPAHKGKPIWAIAAAADGKTLVTAGADTTVKIWDLSRTPPTVRSTLMGHSERIRGLSLSRDGKLLATTSDRDKTIRLWDIDDKPKERAKLAMKFASPAVAFSPDGKTLMAGCSDGVIRAWTIGEAVEEADDVRGGQGAIASLEFSPDGKNILGFVHWSDTEDRAFVWDLKGEVRFESKYSKPIQAVAYYPGGKHLVVVHETNLYLVRLPE